jgi:outer membrane protein
MKSIQGSLSLLLILCAFLCWGTPASASDQVKNTSGASRELSQEDCIAMALKNNKDIKLADSKEAVALATLKYEKSLYFPKLTLYSQAGATNAAGFTLQGTQITPAQQTRENLLFRNRDFYRYEARMEVPIYRDGFFGFKSHKIAKADYGLQQSRYKRDSTKLSIVSQVKDYFLLVQKAQVEQELNKKIIGYSQDVLKLVQEKYHRQLASHKDVLMAEANLAKAQADLAVSENEYQRLAKQLFLLIGASTSAPLRVAPIKQELSPLPIWREVQEKVPANNLDLKASKLDIDIAKENLALSKTNLWPSVDVYARYFGSDSEYRVERDGYASYVFFQVPIFDKSIFKDVKVKK